MSSAGRPIKGVLLIALRARADGLPWVIVPAENAAEAGPVERSLFWFAATDFPLPQGARREQVPFDL